MQQLMIAFDYDSLDTETRIVVRQCATEIKDRIRNTAQGIIEIGERLITVKARLDRGQFDGWLEQEIGWSRAAAYRFIQVAERFGSSQIETIAPSALYLLAAPGTPDEARAEALERAEAGETITHKAAQEIVQAHKSTPDVPMNVPAPAPLEDEEEDDDLPEKTAENAAWTAANDGTASPDVGNVGNATPPVQESPPTAVTAGASPKAPAAPPVDDADDVDEEESEADEIAAAPAPSALPPVLHVSPAQAPSRDALLLAFLLAAADVVESRLDTPPVPFPPAAQARIAQSAALFVAAQGVTAQIAMLELTLKSVRE